MRLRRFIAIGTAAVVPLLGLAAAVPASADLNPPPPGCVVGTVNSGAGLQVQDNGHDKQATLVRNTLCLEFVNKDTINGVNWYQLEDADFGLCINDGAAPQVRFESCPVDNPNELVRITGPNNNLVQFHDTSKYLTAASLSKGAAVNVSSSSTPTAENQWVFTKVTPFVQELPVDFVGPTSADWATIANSEPAGAVENAIFEVCQTVNKVFECGAQNTQADTAWYPTLQMLCNAGIQPLYYIDTAFGADSLATIEAAAKNALTWYDGSNTNCQGGVGIMLDEVAPTDPSDGHGGLYYRDIVNYIVNLLGGTADPIFMNAGTNTTTNYTAYSSNVILQIFENSDANWQTWTPPSWWSQSNDRQVAATITLTPPNTNFQPDVDLAANRGFGNVYISTQATPPPYNTLPSYFDAEALYAAEEFNI